MAKKNLGKGYASVDISSRWLDIEHINVILGVSATHWYTPHIASPQSVYIDRSFADPDREACCWEYRTRRSSRRSPTEILESLLTRFRDRAGAIVELTRQYDAKLTIALVIESTPERDDLDLFLLPDTSLFFVHIGATFQLYSYM